MSTKRYISCSELETVVLCEAKHDFKYGDRLAGSSLVPITPAVRLAEGSMWDIAIKNYNRGGSLADVIEQINAIQPDDTLLSHLKISRLLHRYSNMLAPMGTQEVKPFLVPFNSIIDLTVQPDDTLIHEGDLWLIEYKLRSSLTSLEYLQRNFQAMLYVYGARKSGLKVRGTIFDETLNEEPQGVRHNKNGAVSKVQSCSVQEYLRACYAADMEADPDVVKKLNERKVHQRVWIEHFDFDLESLEHHINSAYSRITMLESGLLYPTRIRYPSICKMCDYNPICEHPDPDMVEFLYTRQPPKRKRGDNTDRVGVYRPNDERSGAERPTVRPPWGG